MLQTTQPVLELRSMPQGVIEGYASVFGGIDSHGHTIVPGAYAASLERHKSAGRAPVMLWSHRQDAPIGRWLSVQEDSRGLQVEGQINLKTAAGRDAFEHISAGDLNGMSIGYRVEPGGAKSVNGRTHLLRVDVHEISVVTLPSDGAARITSVKSTDERPSTVRQFEEALKAMGFTRREAARIATKGFSGFEPDDDTSLPQQELQAAANALHATLLALKG